MNTHTQKRLITKALFAKATSAKAMATKAIVLTAALALTACASHSSTDNYQAAKDAIEINQAALWPKPANPVAKGSENSAALKVVQGFFQAYGKGDMAALKSFVAEDIEWHIPGRYALAGTKRGADEFIAFFNQLGKAGFNAEVMILAANDTYVIDAHRGWSTKADTNIDLNWVLIYQIEDGRIKRVQNFSGDLYRSDEFFNRFAEGMDAAK